MVVAYNSDLFSLFYFLFSGGVYHEACFCPESNTERWEKAMKCPLQFPQIMKDLAPFGNIHLKELAKEAVKRFGTNHALCHYSVINNKVCLKSAFALIFLSLQSVVFLAFFTI